MKNSKLKIFKLLFTSLILCLPLNAFSQTLAPGAPGKDAQWASAGKQAIGTSASLESKVWFTLQGGALTEVYYPDVTVANVHKLEFVVVNPKTKKVETETADATHEIKPTRPDSLTFQQINTAKSGEWKITKTYTTDVERDSVLIDVKFEPRNLKIEYQLYVYYDPSINNTGMHDTAWTEGGLITQDGNIASALIANNIFGDEKYLPRSQGEISNGFLGTSDALTELKNNNNRTYKGYAKAENGNVVQFAPISLRLGIDQNYFRETLYLGFGKNPQEALTNAQNSKTKGFTKCQAEYEKGWGDYVKTLRQVEAKYQAQFNMAAMVLKAQEDKTVRGANVASLTIPWGGGATANEDVGGGYHLVWSRDLYQVVTAYMALGDAAAANRALDFLFNVQQKPDGSFPQNSQLDGTKGWGSLQLDEVAYPLIMAYQLKRFDKKTYENHVKKAADFLVKTGPKTPQERWEEKPGYSPSTIAAEIAGLVCAAEIARKNNDENSANLYLKTADDWESNIEKWTATTTGKYGDGNYYVRLTANGKPDAGEKIELSNSSGAFFENEIVDAGFLELVRLGIKSPDDPLIVKSLKVIDAQIRVNTPNGESFYRYNHDGYGEQPDGRRWNFDGTYSGTGRLWALLAGERGQYELALAANAKTKLSQFSNKERKPNEEQTSEERLTGSIQTFNLYNAKTRLDAMLNFANEGLMIPEQIWDKAETPKNIDKQFVPELKFGEGTGSATPLAWSMAQFIRLAVNLQAGKNLDTPDVVYDRYVGKNSHREDDSVINRFIENGEKLGEPQVKFGDHKKSELQNKQENNSEGNVDPLIAQNDIDNLPNKKRKNPENGKKDKVEISTNCYSDWWDKNKEKQLTKSPIIVNCKDGKFLPIFVYSGKGEKVEVVGDFTSWKPQKLNLTRYQPYAPVEGDFLDFSRYFPLDNISLSARVEYKLIVDGKWITDPLNPNRVDNGVGGENSFFTMPDYQPTEWTVWKQSPELPLDTVKIESKIYGVREVKVYNPGSFEPLPVMYLQDGTDYHKRAEADKIQLNLVIAKKIKPFIMVFLDPKDRMKEYWANDDYAKFLATEIVPAIDAKYKTVKSRDGRAILGASLGGVTSVHAAVKYPEIFGCIGGQSASFWIDNERVIKELETLDAAKNKFKFYFDVGTLEGADDDRKAVEILRGKGYDVTYEERETGHNWTSWRDRLADAFVALWSDAKK